MPSWPSSAARAVCAGPSDPRGGGIEALNCARDRLTAYLVRVGRTRRALAANEWRVFVVELVPNSRPAPSIVREANFANYGAAPRLIHASAKLFRDFLQLNAPFLAAHGDMRTPPARSLGRVCSARRLPTMAGHVPANHANDERCGVARRSAGAINSPILFMEFAILTQRLGERIHRTISFTSAIQEDGCSVWSGQQGLQTMNHRARKKNPRLDGQANSRV